MADGDAGAVIGTFLLVAVAILAIVTAVIIVVVAGSGIGLFVGLKNYILAFRDNVRLERPAMP